MNIKLFGLGLSLALLATTGVYTTPNTPSVELQTPCTPVNTTIAFDIDKVLLDRQMYPIFMEYRWDILKNIFRIQLLYNVGKLLYQNATETAYIELFKAQAPRLAEMVDRIVHEKTPMPGMPELVGHIHDRAYNLVLASNMSAKNLLFYQQKFPELFSNFSYAKVVGRDQNGIESCKKPSLEYFQELNTELAANDLAKPNLIFIDDKKENVDAFATQAKKDQKESNYRGVQFKNAAQLQAELATLGILTAVNA